MKPGARRSILRATRNPRRRRCARAGGRYDGYAILFVLVTIRAAFLLAFVLGNLRAPNLSSASHDPVLLLPAPLMTILCEPMLVRHWMRPEFPVGEIQRDFFLRGVDRVGRVHYIVLHAQAEIAPDRAWVGLERIGDRKSTRLNSSHIQKSRMPSSA